MPQPPGWGRIWKRFQGKSRGARRGVRSSRTLVVVIVEGAAGDGIAAQDLERRGVRTQAVEGVLHAGLELRGRDVDEEQVFPGLAPAGAALDAREVQARLVEGQQAVVERAGTVLDPEHHAGLV